MIRKDAMTLAVAGLLATAGFAHAQSPVAPTLSLDDASTVPSYPALQSLYEQTPAGKPLDNAGLKLYGYVDAGYTIGFNQGHNKHIALRGPDAERSNNFQLDQIDLALERVIADKKKFDVGGKIEWIYGYDTYAYHANGLGFYGGQIYNPGNKQNDPNLQFDLLQAYVDINLPVGNGLDLRVGKFNTFLGYEYVNPLLNPFYSTSLLYNLVPYTHTGVLLNYTFNDQWQAWAGVTRGWDQALKDNNNDGLDGLFSVIYTPNKQWSFTFNGSVGPQDNNDNGHYREEFELVTTYAYSDKWTFGADALFLKDGADFVGAPAGGTGTADDWGLALYASYAFNDYLTFNARTEWLHASDFSFLGNTSNVNVYELTLGVSIKPLPKDKYLSTLQIRPNVRWDHAEDPILRYGNSRDQETFGIDVVYAF